MSESARAILELVTSGRSWVDFTPQEKMIFEEWCQYAKGADLYLLLRHSHRKWSRGASSTSQTLAAIQETDAPPSIPPPKDE